MPDLLPNISSHTFMSSRRNQNLAIIPFLLFFFLISAFSVWGKHTTSDEPAHYEYGMSILNGDATRYSNSKMPVSAWNALPAKIASYLPDGTLKNILTREITARLMTTVFSLAIAVLVFHWSRKLYGFVPALASLTLYVLDPNIIAHSQLVTTDIYAMGVVTFSSYWLWKFANSRKWQDGLWFAIALGFAQLAKYTSVSLYLLYAIALLVHDLPLMAEGIKTKKGGGFFYSEIGRYVKYALIAASVSILVINIGFLFSHTFMSLKDYQFKSELFKSLQAKVNITIPTPYPFLYGFDWILSDEQTGNSYGNIYLLGKIHPVEGFKGYYIVASAVKTPIATQVILWTALIVYFTNQKNRKDFLQNEWFLIWPITFYAIYFNFFFNAQNGIRYYLIIFPLLYVFTGSLFREWLNFSHAQKILSGVLGLYLAASVLSYYPNYLAYFNEIVWDRKMGYKYLADSNIDWGQDIYTFNEYLEMHKVRKIPDVPHPIIRTTTYYVRVNELTGVSITPYNAYDWLRNNFEPTGMIAPSYLLFEITPGQMQDLCSHTNYCE
jgi:hypothetical protein